MLSVHCELQYDVGSTASFAFAVVAARTERQHIVEENVSLNPALPFELVPFGEGGTHQLIRVDVDPGWFTLTYDVVVEVQPNPIDPSQLPETAFRAVPADLLPYLNPSRYCESDKMYDLVDRLFGELEPGFARVQSVSNWVTSELTYAAGSTDASSGTADVLLQRAGVCRDFAHVGISLCRALGVPARYVSGYGKGVEPQDFHGVFEAYLGGEWWLFDPTGMARPADFVRIGYGRDAADASFATFVGQAILTDKTVRVTRLS
ncbi:MAG TPA: transglutaminase family protein [Ilumatobacter sp.]|nr:transglutaminase family protein [Ilumatobacter sp.]